MYIETEGLDNSTVMRKKYLIKLDGNLIGQSYLEKHDAPMGVVFGDLQLYHIDSGYKFFRDYCEKHNVSINRDEAEYNYLDTQNIEGLEVIGEDGTVVKGEASSIRGFDDEGFEIEIIGIPYPFYGVEFKQHVEDYENQFK